jgi:hypothetical protein
VEIFDFTGKKVFYRDLNSAEPSVTLSFHLPPGIYVLKISSGRRICNLKLIVEGI